MPEIPRFFRSIMPRVRRGLPIVLIGVLGLTACSFKPKGLGGWEYVRGEAMPGPGDDWTSYTPRTRIPGTAKEPYFWIRTRLPRIDAGDPALYFYDVRDILEVYLDDRLLFRPGEIVVETDGDRRYDIISSWPVIRLPADSSGHELLIRLVEPADQREGILGGVYLDEHRNLQRRFIAADLDMLVLGFIFMLTALVCVLLGVLRRDNGMIFALALFAFFAGGQALAFSEIIFFLIPEPIQIVRASVIVFMVSALMLFVDRSLGRSPFHVLPIAAGLFFLYGLYLVFTGKTAGIQFTLVGMPLLFFMIGFIIYKALRRELEARIIMAGLFAFAMLTLNDTLLSTRILPNTIFLMQWGMFLLIVSLAVTVMVRFFANESRLREYAHELEIINQAYERFVPAEFLDQLGKESIVAVELGDQVEKSMTVLFSDIRSFTALSEGMSPAETFAFINRFLERMGPVIRRHGGFIDKYIGDAIMALFPGPPDAALRAARDMFAELRTLNHDRRHHGDVEIRIGVGIHLGRLMLGTIGEAKRMEGTVIADAVNLASRLEGLTKKAERPIILSEAVRDALEAPDEFALKFMGAAKVKGKQESVRVYGLDVPAI